MISIFSSHLLSGTAHGFPARTGGVSSAPYGSLNLGLSTADDPSNVHGNRQRVLGAFGFSADSLCLLHQVHGTRIVQARAGAGAEQADAQHTDDPSLLLAVSFADCQPVLYFDPDSGAVAAAHCGWRGTVAGLAGSVVQDLQRTYGSDPARLKTVLGPAICADCYQVGPDVGDRFSAAGLGAALRPDPQDAARHRLDLTAANRAALLQAGVRETNIDDLRLCTSCRPESFYSHRRDRGTTGRHWALISAPGAPGSY